MHLALSGQLADIPTYRDEELAITVPQHIPDVPDGFLNPRIAFANAEVYDKRRQELVTSFRATWGPVNLKK
ncbi:hypothetical protein D2Q93_14880 [Alicyclobacillaceae bacterium I2511]|nr:hypothetical protein D2Q93_14880 [Alicyclobacillaceae bacterium I2511]